MSDEAQEMREQGHGLQAAAHEMEGLIDDDGNLLPGDGEETEEPEEPIAEEPESEDDDSEEPEEAEVDEGDEDSEEASEDDVDEGPAHLDIPDEALDSLVTVKVNGVDEEVPLREALAGYQRQKAFTLKTQELAEQRKAVAAEVTAKQQERQKYADGLQKLEKLLEVPKRDWDKIKAEQPDDYPDLFRQDQEYQARVKEVETELSRVRKEAEEEFTSALESAKQERDETLLATVPGWAEDVERAQTEFGELAAYANEAYGYGYEQINNVVDPNLFVMLRKAKLYDEMSEKGEAVRKTAKKGRKTITLPVGARPTAGKDAKKSKEQKAARSRLSKTGSLSDAVEVFKDFIE